MKVNQTIYDNCVSKYDDNWDIEGTSYTTKITPNLKDGLILFEFSENTSLSSLNIGGKIIESKNCINVILLYESCEKVEVDVIEKLCLNEDCSEYFGNTLVKYLTTDWLEENCECVWSCYKDFCSEQNPIGTKRTCLKYKCGKYFVDVK